MVTIKHCKDCGKEFEDEWDLFGKCSLCRERDRTYTERAIQESLEADDQ